MPKPYGYISDGYVTPDGDLIVCGSGEGGVRALRTTSRSAPAFPGPRVSWRGTGMTSPWSGWATTPTAASR